MIFPLSHFGRHFTTLNDSKKIFFNSTAKTVIRHETRHGMVFSLTVTALVGRGKRELLIKGQSLH